MPAKADNSRNVSRTVDSGEPAYYHLSIMFPRNLTVKTMSIEALLISGTAVLLALMAWFFAPPIRTAEASVTPAAFEEIEQETLKLILSQDPHLLLDARPAESYRTGHLPGARSLPAYEFDTVYPELSHLFSSDLTIIVYCSSASCQDADLLAESLYRQGIGNILLYRGGFAEWEETGNPIVSGERP